MTASHHWGTLPQVCTEVHSLAQQLWQAGYQVNRVKIEAMVYNQDIPVTDSAVLQHPTTNYFEFHIKALLAKNTDLEALRQYCATQGAHLSTNAFKRKANGQHQRFITLRLYGVGRNSAQDRFHTLLTSLRAQGIPLLQPQQEYTVFDSNIELDAGWLEKLGGVNDNA
ncbi:hypothetical protein IQ244_10570 [Nostoc sp. LEGE 06077]|nr:hypothetical protein [Nostoc sp. LEGE 06077]